MTAEGHSVASLHGSKEAEDRDAIIDGFRDGKTKVLITTNVIARGIDISQVNMVVNYDTPVLPDGKADTATYLHRVGGCGAGCSCARECAIDLSGGTTFRPDRPLRPERRGHPLRV